MQRRTHSSQLPKTDWLAQCQKFSRGLFGVFQELTFGVRTKTIPWNRCLVASTVAGIFVFRHWDLVVLDRIGLRSLYPENTVPYWMYRGLLLTLPWTAWALWRLALKRQMLTRLTEVFLNSGLKTTLNRLPSFIFDRALDSETRKLRLYAAGLPLEQFVGAKRILQSSLQIYIDDIRQNVERGTIDIIYAHKPMPETATVDKVDQMPTWQFAVGRTRSIQLTADLRKVPHLLVAGQTGGGKSTFLRQFITTLYLNNPSSQFVLVDLKGGLEFQLFERLPKIEVIPSIKEAVSSLKAMEHALDKRMALLKEAGCKDLEAYHQAIRSKKLDPKRFDPNRRLDRHVIVIDEAAEMFLAGTHASASDIQKARRVLSQIARQGRSVGVHLIIATQRPDSKALDPQVKANLTGVLCFQMGNDASSMTVLGNGRATDLKAIPGRALWKSGADMTEVQTPLMTTTEAESLLLKYRTPVTPVPTETE